MLHSSESQVLKVALPDKKTNTQYITVKVNKQTKGFQSRIGTEKGVQT